MLTSIRSFFGSKGGKTAEPPTRAPATAPPPPETFGGVIADLVASAQPGMDADHDPGVRVLARMVIDDLAANPRELVTLPAFATRILDVLRRPDVDANQLVQVVQQDPAVAAKVLSVANSAFFGGNDVRNIREAVVRLGVRQIGDIALAVATRSLFATRGRAARLLLGPRQRLYSRALTVAFTAGTLADAMRVARSDLAFLGGILLDLGKTAALDTVCSLIVAEKIPVDVDEELLAAALDTVGPVVARQLTSAWNLPEYLTALCEASETNGKDDEPLVAAVRMVAGLATLREGRRPGPVALARTTRAAEILKADGRMARVVLRQLEENEKRVASLFPLNDAG